MGAELGRVGGLGSPARRDTFLALMTQTGDQTAASLRAAWLLFVFAALLAGCTGSSSDVSEPTSEPVADVVAIPVTTEAVVLQSADGVVELEVPAGLVLEGTPLAIEIVDPDAVSGLEGTTPLGSAYQLKPSDLGFAEPLILAYRLPIELTARDEGVPLVFTAVQSDGIVRRAVEQRTEAFDGTHLVHISKIDRFGTLVMLDGGVTFTMEPNRIDGLTAGESFVAALTTTISRDTIELWPEYGLEMRWSASGSLSGQLGESDKLASLGDDAPDWTVAKEFSCDVVGAGEYEVEVGVDVSTHFDEGPTRQFVVVFGQASCGDVGR